LADLQHGHVHLAQLRAAGIGRGALAHRLGVGTLHLALPGVYLLGRPGADLRGRMMAAALYLKGDGLVSGLAAAQLWGMLDTTMCLRGGDPVDVLVVGRSARAGRGIRIHRIGSLGRVDVRRRQGIPVTAPARTLLDCAAVLDAMALETVLFAALEHGLARAGEVRDVLGRNPRAKGIAALRELLEAPARPRDTRSGYERRLLSLLRAAELPLPATNVQVAGLLVDAHWPELGLVVEFDGWAYHRTRAQFETDRLRDQRLAVAGQRVLRITGRQLDHQPYALVARLASLITALRLATNARPIALGLVVP
jgi:very-short-patch-repair endonuclease